MSGKIFFLAMIVLLSFGSALSGNIRAVCSTADLAYFARVIGGDKLDIETIATPVSDLHYVEIRPSFILKLKKADIAFKVGLELDMWMDKLIDGSQNGRLKVVDCSKYIEPLEVPTFKADARYGDLHRFGNPHYWLTPANVEPITRAVIEALTELDPANESYYLNNRRVFLSELENGLDSLKPSVGEITGKEVIFYHNSWPYFASFGGIVSAGFIEPFPGIPPSPSHLAKLTQLIKSRKIKAIAMEPYFDRRIPDKLAADTGAKVIVLYPSIGGRRDGESYLEWLKGNVDALAEALK